jgi:hypothetical protein
MTLFKLTPHWEAVDISGTAEIIHTMANLALKVGNTNLLQNEDIWSKTVKDSVLVSAYPLAMWFASSWWRLNFEPLPASVPSIDWRMAHEMGAANHGYVWPKILFASDHEMIQIWASPSNADIQQSVRYLNGLDKPMSIKSSDFQQSLEDFISSVLARLDTQDCQSTDLRHLWELIKEERSELDSSNYRRLEAELGYDPDECPDSVMDKALELNQKMGNDALSELAPIYGQTSLDAIDEIIASEGLIGKPSIPNLHKIQSTEAPWKRAVDTAQELRQTLSNRDGIIENKQLYDLLGLLESTVESWMPSSKRNNVALAIPENKQIKFVPRKSHPLAKRFELARLLGDYVLMGGSDEKWLTSTDLSTSRQKFQRAFAAEFLCPIEPLKDFLQNDYSESAIEDAAEHFDVSQTTVNSLLKNNGVIYSDFDNYSESRFPYKLAA